MNVHKGKTIEDVIKILGNSEGKGKLIAGGTDIMIDLRNKKISPKVLIDISGIEEMKTISDNEDFIEIGGAVTFTDIVTSHIFDANLYGFKKACRLVGAPQIRNKGTIGGNIANGSPAADSIPPLICLSATIILESTKGKREVSLEDYYIDKANFGIKSDELLTKIRFKKLKENQILSFSKLGLRKALAISRLSIASLLELDDNNIIKTVGISSGSLGRYPTREPDVEEFLLGKPFNEKNIDGAVEVLQNVMDIRLKGRPTLPYKRVAVESMLKEALEEGQKYLEGVKSW